MKTYDPLRAPQPKDWLALSEAKRMALVVAYHARQQIELPNANLHAVIHTVVENQLAMNEPAEVRPTLERLMHEGLDRHDAVHAIGMLITNQMFTILNEGQPYDEQQYRDDLRALSAASYRAACEAAAAAEDDEFFPDADDDAAFFDALPDELDEMDFDDEEDDDEFLR